MGLKSFAKTALQKLFQDYRINWIYASYKACDVIPTITQSTTLSVITRDHLRVLKQSTTAKMRNSAGYSEAGLDGYVLIENDTPVCVAHFSDPIRYDRFGTWKLQSGEMALMDIATEEVARGKGHAVNLIIQTSSIYHALGKNRVIAFIWWSNTPSVRAFTKAGWQRIGFSTEVLIAGKWCRIKLPLKI